MAQQITRFAAGAESAGSDELDPRALLRAFWRRKFMFGAIVALGTGIGVAYAMTATPLYSAETLIRIKPSQPMVIDLPDVGGSFEADDSTISSEIELLESRAFAGRMVDALNLIEDPEFNGSLGPDRRPFWQKIDYMAYLPAPVARFLFGETKAETAAVIAETETRDPKTAERLRTIQAFEEGLSAEQVGRSYVLEVRFRAEKPEKAARIANAIGEAYLVNQLENKYATAEKATQWLTERVAEMRDRVVASDKKIVDFQNARGLSAGGQIDPVQQQLGQINIQLTEAKAVRAEAEARFNQVQSVMRSSGGVEAAAQVLNSPLMLQLRTDESALEQQLAELREVYGERHPQMINLKAELRSVRSKMIGEVERVAQDLSNEVAVARARESELARQVAALRGQVQGQEVSSVELRELEREATSARGLYEEFLTRLRQVTETQNLQQADALILSAATVPVDPAWPNKKLIVILAFGFSGILGAILVFVAERWSSDFGVRSAEEVQAHLGHRALALVPDLLRRDTRNVSAEEYILQKPASAFAEAVQRVRTSIFLADRERTTRTLLVTSSIPVEGKSMISTALARQTAKSGLKTLLIDADLRRPRLHEVVRTSNTNGLADILYGDLTLDDAMRTDERSGLKFVPAGVAPISPPDLFRSERMARLLEEVGRRFDLVIIDSPPVGAVSDSLILSEQVDKTVYVVRWETTPRKLAASGIQQIEDAGGDLAGVILSRVNIKRHAQYGYADSGTYAGYYGKYYQN